MFMIFNIIILAVTGLASAGAISADKARDTGMIRQECVDTRDCPPPVQSPRR